MKRWKKPLVIIIVVFFVLLLVSTGLSRIIYHASMPSVTVETATAGALYRNYTKTAVFSYGSLENEYTAPAAGDIIKVFKEEGDSVQSGDPLYQYDVDALQYEVYQNQLAILKLQQQNEDIEGEQDLEDLEEDEQILYQMNTLQIAIIENLNNEYETIIKRDGLVSALNEGRIVSLSVEAYTSVQKGRILCCIEETTNDAKITWTMSVDEAAYFSVGDELKIPLQIWSDQVNHEEPILITQYYDLTITAKDYLSESDEYQFTIDVTGADEQGGEEIALGMDDHLKITIELTSISETYACIVPRSAVLFDSHTVGSVYCIRQRETITGIEYYAEPFAVSILDEGDRYIAISDYLSGEEIVVKSSKSVDDRAAVQVIR